MLSCFIMSELKHLVRAYGDVEFQRLQQITRMDPFLLRVSQDIKREFYELAGRILTFVSSWDDNQIGPNMMRVFSRRRPAQAALADYRESMKRTLTNDGIAYLVAESIDSQKMKGASSDFTIAGEQSINALNRELREPTELVLFEGGVYECTINDIRRGFRQSQLAYLLDLPSAETVANHSAIDIWIAPAAANIAGFDRTQCPI